MPDIARPSETDKRDAINSHLLNKGIHRLIAEQISQGMDHDSVVVAFEYIRNLEADNPRLRPLLDQFMSPKKPKGQ